MFKSYVENRDRENLRNIGLGKGMQIKKYPHDKYNVSKADKVADNYINQKRKKEAESTEHVIKNNIGYYYLYGRGRWDVDFLEIWRNKLENIPLEINWHAPDPRVLLLACDWLEERGKSSDELRDYAEKIWRQVKVDQNKLNLEPRQIPNKIDYDDVHDRLDNPHVDED